MKKILFVTFMLLISLIPKVKSQSNIETRNEERFKISPLSPNSASLGIFGHTPVGHYTGIPNISVPLYEIDLDGKKIPIAISYHSSGIRVAQESSSIGLGWALNIGGAITKTINGEDDFVAVNNAFPSYYTDILNMSEVHNDLFNMERGAIQAKYYKYISEGGKGEPDVFHYNFLGFSGKFVFDKMGTTYKGHTNTSTSAKAVLIDPQQQLDILFNPVTKVWTIKDLEGYTYGFEQIESSTTFMLSSSARLPYNEATLKQQTFQTKGPIETAYCLTYIESPQKNRITFTYGAEYLQTPISLDERIYYSNAPDLLSYTRYVGGINGVTVYLDRKYQYFSYSYNRIKQLRPTKVTFPGGSLSLLSTSRVDLQAIPNQEAPKRINGVEIKDNSGSLVKSFSFFQSDRNSIGSSTPAYLAKRMVLDSIKENSGATYSFLYNTKNLPLKNSLETDFYGFYNEGQLEGSNPAFETVPSSSLQGVVLFGRDKKPKPALINSMVLETIKYPTGGTTTYQYEPHDLDLSVASTRNIVKTAVATTSIQGQDYNNPCNLIGTTGKRVHTEFDITENDAARSLQLTFRVFNNSSNTMSCGSSSTGFSVWLEELDGTNWVQWKGISSTPKIYTYYVAHNQLNFESIDASAFDVSKKGKYRVVLQVNTPGYVNFSSLASVEFLETQEVIHDIPKGGGLRIARIVDNLGQAVQTRKFEYAGVRSMYVPTFTSKQRILSEYHLVSTYPPYPPLYHYQVPIGGNYSAPVNSPEGLPDPYYLSSTSSIVPFSNAAQGNVIGYSFVTEKYGENGENGFNRYIFENMANRPIQQNPIDFIPFFPTQENVANGNPRSVTRFDKDKKMVSRDSFIYSVDTVKSILALKVHTPPPIPPTDGGFFGFYKVVVENVLLKSLVKTSYVNGVEAQTIAENYQYDPMYNLLKSTKYTQSNGFSRENIVFYPGDFTDNVSNGMVTKNLKGVRLEEVQLVNNKVTSAVKTTYKDTLGMYLPDKVMKLNSAVPLNISTYANSYSNDHFFTKYNSKGKLLEMLGFDRIYTSFLWNTEGLYPVAIIKNSTYNQAATAFINYDLSGYGISDISKEKSIRATLSNSLVTSYTYKPLVGMTSVTDASGRTQYYDYDAAQRLVSIRDQDGMLIQSFCYNYAGQQVDCGSTSTGTPEEEPEEPTPEPGNIIFFGYSPNQSDMCANVPLLLVDGYLSPSTGKYHDAYTHNLLATGYYKKTDGTYLHIENGMLDTTNICPN